MPFGQSSFKSLKQGKRGSAACLKLTEAVPAARGDRVSIRFTGRFGAPAVAGFALGHGLQLWLVSAVVAAALVAGVLLLHAPEAAGSLRRLVRRG